MVREVDLRDDVKKNKSIATNEITSTTSTIAWS